MNKRVQLILISIIFFLAVAAQFASANFIEYTPDNPAGWTNHTDARAYLGMQIKTTSLVTKILTVNVSVLNASNVFIYLNATDGSGVSLIGTFPIVNNISSPNQQLSANSYYWIVVGGDGSFSDYSGRQNVSAKTYPINFTNSSDYTWVSGGYINNIPFPPVPVPLNTWPDIVSLTFNDTYPQLLVSLAYPPNQTVGVSPQQYFNATFIPNNLLGEHFNVTNGTLKFWNSTNNLFATNFTVITTGNVSSSVNLSIESIIPDTYHWNYMICGKNATKSACYTATSNFTFTLGSIVINNQTYDSTRYETQHTAFTFNTSITPDVISASAILYYNGTSYPGSTNDLGLNRLYNVSFDVPLITNPVEQENRTFFWSLTTYNGTNYVNLNTSMLNQTVNKIHFSLCNDTTNVTFINFTFADEVLLTPLNATMDSSTWHYYMGSGEINKSYTFNNLTANPSYGFCFSPPNTTVATTLDNLKYSSTGYPQRTYGYAFANLTNLTTNTTLYLLGSSGGIYSSILVVQGLGTTPIVGAEVLIELQLPGGGFVTVFDGFTDESGITTAWLNPSNQYRYTVSADGFISQQFNLYPSQGIYTVRLETIASGAGAYNSSLTGYKWYVTPRPGTISKGVSQFNLTLVATPANLYSCRFSLINVSDGSILNFTVGGSSDYCNLTVSYNTSNNENYFGRLEINNTLTNGLYQIVDTDWEWVTIDSQISSWTNIVSFFQQLTTLSEFGGTTNRQDFSRIMFFFLITTILLAVFTYYSGFELQNPGVALLLLWFVIGVASVSGFLTFSSGNDNVAPWIRQYGILIIYSMFSIGFVVNQLRRQSQ